jgi:Sugar (pentulose and hexulose) kinases
MAVHLNGASTVTWIANLFNSDIKTLLHGGESNFKTNNLIFLPYLSGERTPHNNPHATGCFFWLTNATTKADMTMAVLEGTAFGIALGYEALMQDPNLTINEISVVGGGSQNDAWGIMFASALKRPLTYRKVREVGAAFGAAKLAWMSDFPSRILPEPEIEKILQPDPQLVIQYESKIKRFKKLYEATAHLT